MTKKAWCFGIGLLICNLVMTPLLMVHQWGWFFNQSLNWLWYWLGEDSWSVLIMDWIVLGCFYILLRQSRMIRLLDWIKALITSSLTGLIMQCMCHVSLIGISGLWGYFLVISFSFLIPDHWNKLTRCQRMVDVFILSWILVMMFGGGGQTLMVHLISLIIGMVIVMFDQVIKGKGGLKK